MQMSGQLPAQVNEAIKKYPDHKLLNGLIRLVEPAVLYPILKEGYTHAEEAVPFAITAFGDILIWERDRYLYKVSLRRQRTELLAAGADYFFEDLNDPEYAAEHFETELFSVAVQTLGPLSDSECYGFVPLEALGGAADVEHMEKVQYREYLSLILQVQKK